MEAIFGATAFVVLFAAWVVVPTIIRKRHTDKEEGKTANSNVNSPVK